MKHREIKFRAWTTTVEWRCEIKHQMIPFDELVYFDDTLADFFAEDENFILMQYTGLKDKNGVEIYEGDIVQYNNITGEIAWHQNGWVIQWMEMQGYSYIYEQIIEVIGNIHENPELL
jgi:uncharacterized phage protein (TIGR01671 family)